MKRIFCPLIALLLLAGCNLPRDHKRLIGLLMDNAPQQQAEVEDTGALLPAPLTDRPEQILHRAGYTASYNHELKLPNWVAWHLTADHTNGPFKRKGRTFTEDEEVEEPRANTYDYQRSGYDRGHMCPSADNRWSEQAQADCFLLTNICPQLHALNDGDWRILEEQCRDWADDWGDLYIVCGPVLTRQRHKRIGKTR